MKHADADALARLAPLLQQHLRPLCSAAGVREKQPGVFYRAGRAFLHFHTDPAGLFADVRLSPGAAFTRFPLRDAAQQQALVEAVRQALPSAPRAA